MLSSEEGAGELAMLLPPHVVSNSHESRRRGVIPSAAVARFGGMKPHDCRRRRSIPLLHASTCGKQSSQVNKLTYNILACASLSKVHDHITAYSTGIKPFETLALCKSESRLAEVRCC